MKILYLGLSLAFMLSPGFAQEPEELAKKYLAMVHYNNWDEPTKLFSPAEIDGFHKTMLPIAWKNESLRNVWFGQGVTKEEINEVNAEEFFAWFFEHMFSQIETEFKDINPLGVVYEGDSLAHVVVRNTRISRKTAIKKLDVISMRKEKGRWRLLLSGDLEEVRQRYR